MRRISRSAFTVVELSVVLFVIGILIGGIFTAQELIRSSKISAIVAEFTSINQAKVNFMDKYHFRPGDVPASYMSQFFTGNAADPGACIGGAAGNGIWSSIQEIDYAWLQLSYTDMIKQKIDFNPCTVANGRTPGTHRPASDSDAATGYTFGNVLTINTDAGGAASGRKAFQHYIRLGKMASSTDNLLDGDSFPVYIHRAIDAKIDQVDTPYTGKYIVGEGCINKAGGAVYYTDSDSYTCTGNLVEIQELDSSKF